MDRVDGFMPAYREVFERYLLVEGEIPREQALLDAGEIGKLAVAQGLTIDQMFELHRRTQSAMAKRWMWADTGVENDARETLARGGGTPLMLSLIVPHQMAQMEHHERRWRRDNETLTTMFEQTDDLIVILDDEGQIDDVNPAFLRATGWSKLEAVSGLMGDWPTPLTGQVTRHCRAEQQRADGSGFVVEWSVSPLLGRDGKLLSHVCVGRDMTRQQQIEDGLRENDKLRAVATLAGGIAHDFNNLLGSIMGLTELCELDAAKGSRQARNLVGIRRAGDKATALVRQMLDFSRQTPRAVQRLLASEVLGHSEALLRATVPHGLGLAVRVDSDGPVEVDLVQMEQVLLNMIRNAAYAMRERGGDISIVVDHADPAGAAAHTGAAPRHLRFRVIDTGEGIAPDVLGKIFDPFFTTKPVGDGTGLGLAAAHGIVNHHGGVIEVASEWSVGTTFSVFLPQADALAGPDAGPDAGIDAGIDAGTDARPDFGPAMPHAPAAPGVPLARWLPAAPGQVEEPAAAGD